MSAISDFNKVWLQKCPGSELPAAWEEDVKTNLAKHKKRVSELQDELKEEELYVEFLESLLEEVEKRKGENGGPSKPMVDQPLTSGRGKEIEEAIEGTIEHRSRKVDKQTEPITPTDDDDDEDDDDEEDTSNEKADEEKQAEEEVIGEERDNKELTDDGHFVTVIKVNGFEKELNNKGGSSHQPPPRPQNKSPEEGGRNKKVPPRPPPKSFKFFDKDSRPSPSLDISDEKIINSSCSSFGQQGGEGGSQNQPSSLRGKRQIERPVIFDSKKGSREDLEQIDQTPYYSKVGPKNPGGKPRYEGSRFPLPSLPIVPVPVSAEPNDLDENRRKGSIGKNNIIPPSESPKVSRSKIQELVNKMESSQKPMLMAKKFDQPQLSNKPSFNKRTKRPLYPKDQDEIVSDYVDPCDAEFEEQIYDSPPPEDIEDLPIEPIQPLKEEIKKLSLEKPKEKKRGKNQNRIVRDGHEGMDLENEPMYDTVAPDQDDDYVLLDEGNQTGSSNNSLFKNDSSLPRDNNHPSGEAAANDGLTIKSQTSMLSSATTNSSGTMSDTDSPLHHDNSESSGKSSNYVNIDYFLKKSKRKDSRASGESEDEESVLQRAISIDQEGDSPNDENPEVYEIESGLGSTGDLAQSSLTDSFGRDGKNSLSNMPTMTVAENEKFAIFRYMLSNIAESESSYVEVLNVMIQYMKALKATILTSKPVLSTDDLNIIFYKIPELFALHQKFLNGIQHKGTKTSVGSHFELLARDVGLYGSFLQNYSRAVDTVRKCSQNNQDFAEITRSIRLRSMNKNQAVSLETLLYSPVSRIQKNIEIIQDLLKCLPESHPDYKPLKNALRDFQSFLSEFKMIQPEQLFQGQDRNPRHLVKNSFIVELSEGNRKLRHLFLFNDVLLCAKYKASGKEKFTFELKWYIPVNECAVVEENSEPRESAPINLVALRSQASTVRDQIKRQTSRDDSNSKKSKAEKQRKKLAELEAQLVLASPNLVFKVKSTNGRSFTFFLSSEYERSQWVDAIDALRSSQPSPSSHLSMTELQAWLTSCRNHLKTNMGSYLLRTGRDETLLVGDFYILIGQLKGISRPADLYVCVEVDSYGHFFRKAKTKMICESTQPCWNQDFVIELEGAQNLRILLYEDHPRQGTLIRAKATIELNRNWMSSTMSERKIELQDYVLTTSTKFVPFEMTIRRVPTAKPAGLFGAKISQVLKREKRQIPFILTSCVREVERRGINEVGIYRVSGSASDVSRLKKAFETNSYEAEQFLKEVDIHSVTGTLKLYMRELPEALFTDELYPKFFEAFNMQEQELKKKQLLQLFSTLPPINQHLIVFLLDHMVRVNNHENHNKMSLHNMATVFGPTLLRPGAKAEGIGNADLLAAGTVDVMAQAGILYFFLSRRANGEPLQV